MNQYCLKWFFVATIQIVFGYNNNDHLKPSDEARIINGKIVDVSEVPSIVQLLRNNFGNPYCAGTLITENRVLTAAHCVYNLEKGTYVEQIYIRYGTSYSYKSPYPLIKVVEIWRHPDFMLDHNGDEINDIAILILDQIIIPSKDVGYAKLPEYNFNDKRTVTVYGWAGDDLYEHLSPTLRKTEMIARPTWQCVNINLTQCSSVRDCKIICATSKFSGANSGDSGGPVFLPNKTLVGIILAGFENNSFESPFWEENKFVRVFHRLDFINLKEKYDVKNLKTSKPQTRKH
ncbi:hypothetical protein RDWZM_000825 [Blomia tropicalis]|uniref:Peptidase S1 domain-containing protein n=1 Tax=Blomia tropicalis TaxID=40697 RepID=A0A9Q0RQ62_BLOTA|nr:hypothetical protein RDWZM_000825 [Blomia tropicalis]